MLLAGGAVYFVLVQPPIRLNPAPSMPADCPPSGSSGSQSPTAGNWTTYHGNNSRTGFLPMGGFTAVNSAWMAPTTLNGQVYAEPLLCADVVYVATEGDSVYAVNATTGGVLWQTNLGPPVPGTSLPCGDISPSGITGTPVIDLATGTLYVVAFLDLSPLQHVLFGLSTKNGAMLSRAVVDAAGSNPEVEQQRGALALANGFVYIPYGGLAGDCGSYHGWVVGVPTSGTQGQISYQVPTGRAGGIWSPSGITIAPNGDLLVATGNSDATTTFDYGDAVIELSPALQPLQYFAPSNWAYLNTHDVDLGSVAPTILPDGDVFQVGKAGVGYLLSGSNLGGVGGQIYNTTICSSAYGGNARVGSDVLVSCMDGVVEVVVGATSFSVGWRTPSFDAGAPVVVGGVVWAVNLSAGNLIGFNLSTGVPVYALHLGTADHFITPVAAPGSLFVAAGDQLEAFSLT